MNNLKHPRYQPGDIKIINELTNRRILFLVDPKLLQFTIYQNSTLKKKTKKPKLRKDFVYAIYLLNSFWFGSVLYQQ
jgi:hypothetical protein